MPSYPCLLCLLRSDFMAWADQTPWIERYAWFGLYMSDPAWEWLGESWQLHSSWWLGKVLCIVHGSASTCPPRLGVAG